MLHAVVDVVAVQIFVMHKISVHGVLDIYNL